MIKKLLFALLPVFGFSQGYTSYFTGNPTNITTTPEFGVCLMGGATEHDNAMMWLLQKANGGDVVVLRSSGSNGYNNYLYSELGVTVNSVETLVITSVAGATNPYVLDKVANAEMIWFAGGDQWNYVSFFKNNALEDLINNHINNKHAPIGGTSAGMAILGSAYFSAQNGSISSAAAMNNPFGSNVTIGTNDFVMIPVLSNTITDTHFDNPDRKGRLSTFLARLKTDYAINYRAIAANEYVAVCIGTDGKAKVYGDYPNYQEFAYFVQTNCESASPIENCSNGQPLTWNNGGKAMKAYKVPGTMNGTNYFDLNNWQDGIGVGGSWENWAVVSGSYTSSVSLPLACDLGNPDFNQARFDVIPNPFSDYFAIDNAENAAIELYDFLGKRIFSNENYTSNIVEASGIDNGMYFLKITRDGTTVTKKIIKQ